jgi:predicted nucleic acid-binding protein
MEKEKESRTIITFDCGSTQLKEKAIEFAKNFEPIKISLSDLCQIALKEYLGKNKK